MVKCLLLQKWFGLSDPGLEEMLRDRLSFRRFVGLSLDERDARRDDVREVPRPPGGARARLDVVRRGAATARGARDPAERGDAGRRQRAAGQPRPLEPRSDARADLHTRDKAASNTHMYGRTYFGFKGHIATDVRGFVKDYRFDTAATHESKLLRRR